MPSFSLRQRFRRSRPANETSDSQPPAGKYYLLLVAAAMRPFTDCFCLDGTTIVSEPEWHISMHDEVAMGAIQTALAALKEGSSLATKLPFIAPIAGLLLQALTMWDVRVTHISSDNILMHVSLGSEAM